MSSGEYSVQVRAGENVVLTWSGYADNPTDALYQAISLREEIMERIVRREEGRE
jgi:hypothetical protein